MSTELTPEEEQLCLAKEKLAELVQRADRPHNSPADWNDHSEWLSEMVHTVRTMEEALQFDFVHELQLLRHKQKDFTSLMQSYELLEEDHRKTVLENQSFLEQHEYSKSILEINNTQNTDSADILRATERQAQRELAVM
jgi:hypothetical protein